MWLLGYPTRTFHAKWQFSSGERNANGFQTAAKVRRVVREGRDVISPSSFREESIKLLIDALHSGEYSIQIWIYERFAFLARGAARFSETGTGFACAKLSEIRS
ncbi:hypothetical protein, partial [Candidatus Binatus sp.]|uniref:hypothetical protein n=1 Tax=Candidatus Binatus sp. TaxID=2811406 RepID=UPI003C3CD3AD